MFHAIYLIRLDIYITYNRLVEEEERLEQKDFVLEMVNKCLEILTTLSYYSPISVHEKWMKEMSRTLYSRGGGG